MMIDPVLATVAATVVGLGGVAAPVPAGTPHCAHRSSSSAVSAVSAEELREVVAELTAAARRDPADPRLGELIREKVLAAVPARGAGGVAPIAPATAGGAPRFPVEQPGGDGPGPDGWLTPVPLGSAPAVGAAEPDPPRPATSTPKPDPPRPATSTPKPDPPRPATSAPESGSPGPATAPAGGSGGAAGGSAAAGGEPGTGSAAATGAGGTERTDRSRRDGTATGGSSRDGTAERGGTARDGATDTDDASSGETGSTPRTERPGRARPDTAQTQSSTGTCIDSPEAAADGLDLAASITELTGRILESVLGFTVPLWPAGNDGDRDADRPAGGSTRGSSDERGTSGQPRDSDEEPAGSDQDTGSDDDPDDTRDDGDTRDTRDDGDRDDGGRSDGDRSGSRPGGTASPRPRNGGTPGTGADGNADSTSTGSTSSGSTGRSGNTDTGNTGRSGNTDTGNTDTGSTGSTGRSGNTSTGTGSTGAGTSTTTDPATALDRAIRDLAGALRTSTDPAMRQLGEELLAVLAEAPVVTAPLPGTGDTATGTGTATGTAADVLPATVTALFHDDFESGRLEKWGTCQGAGINGDCAEATVSDGMGVAEDPERGLVAQFSVVDGREAEMGGERSEVRDGNNPGTLVEEGDDRWYTWSMKFPADFPDPDGGWNIVMQWHQQADSGSPPLALDISRGSLDIGGDGVDAPRETIGPLRRGEWVDYVLHVGFSTGDGFVEAWENGVQTVPRTARPTMTDEASYLKMGIYRDPNAAGDAEVLFDDFTIHGS